MLRVFALVKGKDESEPHAFTFTSPTAARAEAEAIKDGLSKIIQASKPVAGTLAASAGGGGDSISAAMAIASAISSVPSSTGESASWYDDGRLKSDVQLQQSLLKANSSLSKTFMESLRTKPDSITTSQFTSQFWATRLHLLRAHAIEKSQTRGAYNVLSTIRPKTEDNTIKLSISKEQIQLIFNQHPLVKRVYDENVPKLNEAAFWSAFFQSRLFKKLKGEKTSEDDPTHPILDKYLQSSDDDERSKRLLASHIPHIIDVEGNEENHSQRQGNQPDFTMRPSHTDRVPIIRTLNSLSEKLISHIPPNDIDPSMHIGVDEETFNSLALRDLQAETAENHVILNIKEQSRFFTPDKGDNSISADALLYSRLDPSQVLHSLNQDLAHLSPTTNLDTATGMDEDSSDSENDPHPPKPRVGSKSGLAAATSQILSAIAQQRAQTDDMFSINLSSTTANTASPAASNLSPTTFDRLVLTHATTTEFLSHFWTAFLSGSPDHVDEIAKLVETLDHAMDRINAVIDTAGKERDAEVDKVKNQIRERFERTGRKVRFDFDTIGGGAKVARQLLAPTIKAIEVAGNEYRKALTAATAAEAEGEANA